MSKHSPSKSSNHSPILISTSLRTILSAYLPPIAWAALIFFLSSQQTLPGPSVSALDYLFKKSAHIFVYFVLAWLLQRALHISTSLKPKIIGLTSLLICLFYAASDEYHQSFTPGRFASIYDVGYDMIGASLSVMIRSNVFKTSR